MRKNTESAESRLQRAYDREAAANRSHQASWSIFEAARTAHTLAAEAAKATGAELLNARAERIAAERAVDGSSPSGLELTSEKRAFSAVSLGGTELRDNVGMKERLQTRARR